MSRFKNIENASRLLGTNLGISKLDTGLICGICHGNITSDDIFYTPCSHVFHLECLTESMCHSSTCPSCRQNICYHTVRQLRAKVSRAPCCGRAFCFYRSCIDRHNATITEQHNLILKYEAQLAKNKATVLKIGRKMGISTMGSPCTSRVTRSRARCNENSASVIESPATKIDKAITNIKSKSMASFEIERQKCRETSEKLQEEHAHVSDLQKELHSVKTMCNDCKKWIEQLENAAGPPFKRALDYTAVKTEK